MHIYEFTKVILNENRWSTNYIPTLVSTELVEVFLPLGLNQVQGLILGLVFQVGGLRVSGTRVKSTSWTRVTEQSSTPKIQTFMVVLCAPHPRFSDQFGKEQPNEL